MRPMSSRVDQRTVLIFAAQNVGFQLNSTHDSRILVSPHFWNISFPFLKDPFHASFATNRAAGADIFPTHELDPDIDHGSF